MVSEVPPPRPPDMIWCCTVSLVIFAVVYFIFHGTL